MTSEVFPMNQVRAVGIGISYPSKSSVTALPPDNIELFNFSSEEHNVKWRDVLQYVITITTASKEEIHSVVDSIHSDSYALLKPIPVTIESETGGYIASVDGLEISVTADSAFLALKALTRLSTFEKLQANILSKP